MKRAFPALQAAAAVLSPARQLLHARRNPQIARTRKPAAALQIAAALGLLFLLFFPAETLSAQQNPFLSSPGSEAPPETSQDAPQEVPQKTSPKTPPEAEESAGPGHSTLQRRVSSAQRELYSRLSTAMGRVKSGDERAKMLAIVVSISFIYGLLHALGPGHRKTVLFSYFVAHKVPLSRGIAAGAGMALLHGAAAIALILPIYLLLRGSILVTFNAASRYIELVTFIFIALFGAVMLTHSLWSIFRSKNAENPGSVSRPSQSGSTSRPDHQSSAEAEGPARPNSQPSPAGPAKNKGNMIKPDQTRPAHDTYTQKAHDTSFRKAGKHKKSMTALIIGSGLVPCPGAATILLFALSMQMMGVGIMAVAAMSLGMAATLAGVAFFTLGARSGLQRIGGSGSALTGIIHHTLEIGGYILITVFGLVMTLGYM